METYAYDAAGLRRRHVAGGSTTHFLWDGVNLLAELDEALVRSAQYTDFPGRWGGLSSQRRDGTTGYFSFDLSANTRALLDGAQALTDAYLYRAFGVEQAAVGATSNAMRFGGQVGYYRDLAERVYVRARWYRPRQGVWCSRDPLVSLAYSSPNAASDLVIRLVTRATPLDAYFAFGNDPIGKADPTGLQCCRPEDYEVFRQSCWRGASRDAWDNVEFGLRQIIGVIGLSPARWHWVLASSPVRARAGWRASVLA